MTTNKETTSMKMANATRTTTTIKQEETRQFRHTTNGSGCTKKKKKKKKKKNQKIMWLCEICHEMSFDTSEKCVDHEKSCTTYNRKTIPATATTNR